MQRYKKFGVCLPREDYKNLEYLVCRTGQSRSKIIGALVSRTLGDMTAILQEMEETAAAQGVAVSDVSLGPEAERRFEAAMKRSVESWGDFRHAGSS